MKQQTLFLTLLSVLLFSCAAPTVVDVNKVGGQRLSCHKIEDEITKAETFEKKARGERKVTGKNVAAALLFWPALIGTYSNTEDAINAAKERKAVLLKLYNDKGCK